MSSINYEECIKVIVSIISGFEKDQDVEDLYKRLENIQKFLLTLEERK